MSGYSSEYLKQQNQNNELEYMYEINVSYIYNLAYFSVSVSLLYP